MYAGAFLINHSWQEVRNQETKLSPKAKWRSIGKSSQLDMMGIWENQGKSHLWLCGTELVPALSELQFLPLKKKKADGIGGQICLGTFSVVTFSDISEKCTKMTSVHMTSQKNATKITSWYLKVQLLLTLANTENLQSQQFTTALSKMRKANWF